MKKMKGILALALALAMICSSLAALAEEHKGEEDEPLEDGDVIEPSSGETANN